MFATFFEGALHSHGACNVVDKAMVGRTRLCEYNPQDNSIHIGNAFYGTRTWGTGTNAAVKALLLDYVFGFVDTVRFHIGACNVRSQIAIQRLGAVKVAEQEVTYFGEAPTRNYVFEVSKPAWAARKTRTTTPPDSHLVD